MDPRLSTWKLLQGWRDQCTDLDKNGPQPETQHSRGML